MKSLVVGVAILVLFVGMGPALAQGAWDQVVGPNASTPAGFGDAGNTIAMSSASVNSGTSKGLYIGTLNDVTGSEVWRTTDGCSWQQVNTDGFGGDTPSDNEGTYSMSSFLGKVYAGTWGSTPIHSRYADPPSIVWRYDDTTSWPAANTTSGFAQVLPSEIWAMKVFTPPWPEAYALYVGVSDFGVGAVVWRSLNGTSWSQASDPGFGIPGGYDIRALEYFNEYMYAVVTNTYGFEVLRTNVLLSHNDDWTNVSPTGYHPPEARSMTAFNGYLYLAATDGNSGLSVYRTANGTSWSVVPQTTGGFGDTNNYAAYDMYAYDGALYLGTHNAITGTEVWRTTNGTTWSQVSTPGFGDVNNHAVVTFSEFNGVLYAATRNDNGCQVWELALFADGFESGTTTGWSNTQP